MAGKPRSLKARFDEAQKRALALEQRPTNEQLLELYALFKQATAGDVSGPRPGLLDPRGRAKHDAWSRQTGVSTTDAMEGYVALVGRLERSKK
jgi:acyl-CoA-binding protein